MEEQEQQALIPKLGVVKDQNGRIPCEVLVDPMHESNVSARRVISLRANCERKLRAAECSLMHCAPRFRSEPSTAQRTALFSFSCFTLSVQPCRRVQSWGRKASSCARQSCKLRLRGSGLALLTQAQPMPERACTVPTVLTIAGSDSGGGAGIQADLKTFAACGVYGTSAITALTAQNTEGVCGIEPISAAFVAQQIDVVLSDIPTQAVKTGMLPNREIVREVAKAVQGRPGLRLVVDPVLVTTSGHDLATREVAVAIKEDIVNRYAADDRLFPLASVVTPNLSEASVLVGGAPIDNLESMQHAANVIHDMGSDYVLIKGGHLNDRDTVADVLYDGREMRVMHGPRIQTGSTHGTGCTTASAIAAYIAKGLPVPAAIEAARAYVTEALRKSARLAIGNGKQRPFNHLFALHDWQASSDCRQSLDLRLYAVTDPDCNKRCMRSNAEAVESAITGGATFVQLREKHAEGGRFCQEATAVLAVTRSKGVKLVINDRIDVAIAVGADGVHLGQDDIPIRQARQLLGPGKILGASVKTVEQAKKAEADGADYLGAGAMHQTATKSSSTISIDTLSAICQAVSIPVVAIGGINAQNSAPCIEAGAAGVAVVSAIFGAQNPASAAEEILTAVRTKLSARD